MVITGGYWMLLQSNKLKQVVVMIPCVKVWLFSDHDIILLTGLVIGMSVA